MKTLPILLTIAAIPVAASAVAQSHHSVKKHTKSVASAAGDPTIVPLVGTWYVTDHGIESHAQRLALRKNGTFAFIGSGWKSEGKFKLREGNLALEWTAVDGTPVKAGSMHKNIVLNREMNSFVIDRYTYEKHAE